MPPEDGGRSRTYCDLDEHNPQGALAARRAARGGESAGEGDETGRPASPAPMRLRDVVDRLYGVLGDHEGLVSDALQRVEAAELARDEATSERDVAVGERDRARQEAADAAERAEQAKSVRDAALERARADHQAADEARTEAADARQRASDVDHRAQLAPVGNLLCSCRAAR